MVATITRPKTYYSVADWLPKGYTMGASVGIYGIWTSNLNSILQKHPLPRSALGDTVTHNPHLIGSEWGLFYKAILLARTFQKLMNIPCSN